MGVAGSNPARGSFFPTCIVAAVAHTTLAYAFFPREFLTTPQRQEPKPLRSRGRSRKSRRVLCTRHGRADAYLRVPSLASHTLASVVHTLPIRRLEAPAFKFQMGAAKPSAQPCMATQTVTASILAGPSAYNRKNTGGGILMLSHFEPATFGDIAILSGFHILADYESRPRLGVAGAMGQAMLPRRLSRPEVAM